MYLTINNQNIYYQKLGKGQNLIMLHGWGQDVSTWWGITDLLKDNFTLWLIDLPGFGRSENPQKPFMVKDYAQIVEGFIREQNIKDPILLGHSLGGRIAIYLASHLGGVKLNKLILEDAAGIKPKRDLLKFIIYPIAKTIKYLLPDWFDIKTQLRQSFYKSLESDYINAGPLTKTLTNILKEDLTPDLPRIKTDTLLIWGEKDPTKEASLENGKKIYQLIKNSRLEIIDEVGHFPHLENKDRFVYWVKNFAL